MITVTHSTFYRAGRSGHEVGSTFAGRMVWLAVDPDATIAYLRREAGYLYTIEIEGRPLIADEATLCAVGRKLGYEAERGDIEYNVHELVEIPEVVEALRFRGFAGAEYGETDPQGRPMQTLCLFDGAAAKIVEREPVPATA